MIGLVAAALVAGAGCDGAAVEDFADGGDLDGGGAAADAAVEPATLAFLAPTAGAVFARDVVDDFGYLVASIDAELARGGPIERVDVSTGAAPIGVADAAGHVDLALRDDGAVTLTARGYDADGAMIAEAAVEVIVAAPEVADCRGWLDLYGQAYTVGPSNEGVPDPVTLTTPINGVVFRYIENASPRATFFMDCELALSLVRAAPHFRERGVVEVSDYGVYNYRCIGTGTPPDCPSGMSQHAFARAIDLTGFTKADGTVYTVLDDWIIDDDAVETCDAILADGGNAWLHDLICELKDAGTWNIVLTPNYNASHRDHFHVDLTPGSDFLRAARHSSIDVGPDDY